MLAGCGQNPSAEQPDRNAAPVNQVNEVEPALIPVIQQPLARRDLLLAVADAASDYTIGRADPERQRELDGQAFVFRMRICDGPEPGVVRSYDEKTQVLRMEVQADLRQTAPVIGRIVDKTQYEAVEGFWVARPWLLEAGCPKTVPAGPAEGETAMPPMENSTSSRVGIVQFFKEDDARSGRRGERSYEVTRKLDEGEEAGPIDLVLTGRLRALAGGKVISCTGSGAQSPPICVVSARIDQLRLELPSGESLAEWGSS